MIVVSPEILKKHEIGIEAARKYYVLNQATGFSDEYYTEVLEAEARKDGLELRDYVMQEVQGKRSMNADYITKVEKLQVSGNMLEALDHYDTEVEPEIAYEIPKYDGSSLAAYYDPATGKLCRIVTIGGSNLGSEGIDQTEKLGRYFPDLPNTGIQALQCECLVSLEHGFGERSRQKANGIINSSYIPLSFQEFKGGKGTERSYRIYLKKFEDNLRDVEKEIDEIVNIRAFRFFLAPGVKPKDYRKTILGLPVVRNAAGDIKFCGGFVFRKSEKGEFINSDIWKTPTGTFLVDGVVGYSKTGECIKALKYKDAGRGEATEVLGLKWTNQVDKGKDSWSCNALINPIEVRGSEVRKPVVGSLTKMVERGLSKGAKVTVILANSTIPQVANVVEPGNRDYEWPVCSCGYQMGPLDIYGTRLKCGNHNCSERYSRMIKYLESVRDPENIDLTKLLVLDGFDWKKKLDPATYQSLLHNILRIVSEGRGVPAMYIHLERFLSTPLQKKNLNLVVTPAYEALQDYLR
jgi:hypothetical protein